MSPIPIQFEPGRSLLGTAATGIPATAALTHVPESGNNPAVRLGPSTLASAQVYTAQRSPQNISADEAALWDLYYQQQAMVGDFFASLGQPTAPAGDLLDGFSDPAGDALDYFLGSTGSSGGAGDVFSLALTANGLGREIAQLSGTTAAQAEAAYQQGDELIRLVEDAKQSNLDLILSLGGSAGSGALTIF